MERLGEHQSRARPVIPEAFIVEWSSKVNWPTPEQVEQDLVLSRLIVDIANDAYLGKELVFRGGTCLHKIHLPSALRYSEDLDYVRTSSTGIGPLLDAIRAIGERLGMEVRTDVRQYPKAYLRATFESGPTRMRIKVEVNTYELHPASTLQGIAFGVDSQWFQGRAEVLTFRPEELVATKLRALYQRSKGRDLFDLWLALTRLGLDASEIVRCFAPYRPTNYSARLAETNLRRKMNAADFRNDLRPLVVRWPEGYDIDSAGELVIAEVFSLL